MSRKTRPAPKHWKLVFAVGLVIGPSFNYAAAMEFFGSSIDYWHKETKSPKTEVSKLERPAATMNSTNDMSEKSPAFEWSKYLDPKNPEFFREGDYLPPEPFMEIVRNPTDRNIQMWFSYLNKKNELSARLAKRMEEYSKTNSQAGSANSIDSIKTAIARVPTPSEDFKRFRFRMYFDSNCPHCKRMFETLRDLQDRGYFVEARQIDQGSLAGIKSPVTVVSATADEIKKFKVSAVPLLLIGDLHEKKVYRQSGFMTTEEVIGHIRAR